MIEIIHNHIERGRVRHALFDFDGTVSLIREGWQQVMIPMMVELLLQTPAHESEAELRRIVTDFVTRLTGKQTIYQMIRLADEIAKRGGQPSAPLVYKHQYLDLLWERIKELNEESTLIKTILERASLHFVEGTVGRATYRHLTPSERETESGREARGTQHAKVLEIAHAVPHI